VQCATSSASEGERATAAAAATAARKRSVAPAQVNAWLSDGLSGVGVDASALPMKRKCTVSDDYAAAYTYDSDADAAATAATSFGRRGPQCLLTLGRSTSPLARSLPCACVPMSPLYYKPSVSARDENERKKERFSGAGPCQSVAV